MPSYNDRLIQKIEGLLRTRAKMIVIQFRSPDGGVVDRPPLMIGGSVAAQARVLDEWQKSRAARPSRVASADAPSQSPDSASPSPVRPPVDSGGDHGAE